MPDNSTDDFAVIDDEYEFLHCHPLGGDSLTLESTRLQSYSTVAYEVAALPYIGSFLYQNAFASLLRPAFF